MCIRDSLRVGQDDVAELLLVRQSNISYRCFRSYSRLRLHEEIHRVASETTLRRALIDAGSPPDEITIVLAILKTFSQSLPARALGSKQSLMRCTFMKARERVARYVPDTLAEDQDRAALLRMMNLVATSWNQLCEIEPQSRYAWKRGRETPTQAAPAKRRRGSVRVPFSPGGTISRGTLRRVGRYYGVQRLSGSPLHRAFLTVDLGQVDLGTYATPHEAAHATNFAAQLLAGPEAPVVNPIAPEDALDAADAAQVREKVQLALRRKGIIT